MVNVEKRNEFNEKVREMFLSEKTKNLDIGPTRHTVFDLLTEYNIYLLKHEQTLIKERMLFVVQYLSHCRHSGRPIDWILVERLIDGCLENLQQ